MYRIKNCWNPRRLRLYSERIMMKIIILLYIMVLSIFDIRERKVPVLLLAIGAGFALFRAIISDVVMQWNNDIIFNVKTIIIASLPGMILLGMALITQNAGTADGIVLSILGILSDWKSAVLTLSISLFIMGAYSVILLLLRKVNKKSEIPFIPFMCLAYTIYAFMISDSLIIQ